MKTWQKWVLGIGGALVALFIVGSLLPDDDETDFSGIDSKELERIINEGIDSKLLEDIIARTPATAARTPKPVAETELEQFAETDVGLAIMEAGYIQEYIADGTSRREAQCTWDVVEKDAARDVEFWSTATDAEAEAWMMDWFLDGDNLKRLSRCW